MENHVWVIYTDLCGRGRATRPPFLVWDGQMDGNGTWICPLENQKSKKSKIRPRRTFSSYVWMRTPWRSFASLEVDRPCGKFARSPSSLVRLCLFPSDKILVKASHLPHRLQFRWYPCHLSPQWQLPLPKTSFPLSQGSTDHGRHSPARVCLY